MAKLLTTSTDHLTLFNLLGNRAQRTIGNNTVLRHTFTDAIAVRLHATDILTVEPNGNVTLNSDGYWTVTTKDRLNAFLRPLGAYVRQVNYEWFLQTADGVTTEWQDGITLNSEGERI